MRLTGGVRTGWLLAVTLLGVSRIAAAEEGCFPQCRAGYVCSPEHKCVSECNPPCEANESCNAGACVARAPAAAATSTAAPEAGLAVTAPNGTQTQPRPTAGSRDGWVHASETRRSSVAFTLLGGPSAYTTTSSASSYGVGAELTGQGRFGGGHDAVHGFVLGLRLGLFAETYTLSTGGFSFANGYPIPVETTTTLFAKWLALDLGYSGRFEFNGGNAGPIFLLSPAGRFVEGNSSFAVELTAGGRVQIGPMFELQLPLRFVQGLSEGGGSVVQASLLAGVTL